MHKLNQKKYLKAKGQLCPHCGWDTLEFSDGTNDIGEYYETVDCLACEIRFFRIFKLYGYEIIPTRKVP